ncbi:MAG: hypothetical protein AMJ45_02045 [Syntrophobacter sp. DG_60]|nr:MAG: hypothetical protein AMJ45_02045 [Syntrophobacter sp. DG_60]
MPVASKEQRPYYEKEVEFYGCPHSILAFFRALMLIRGPLPIVNVCKWAWIDMWYKKTLKLRRGCTAFFIDAFLQVDIMAVFRLNMQWKFLKGCAKYKNQINAEVI